MNYKSFNDRLTAKLANVCKEYEKLMFCPVQIIEELEGFECLEHLYTPPTGGYKSVKTGYQWGGEYKNIWLKTAYTVPAELNGKALYLMENTGGRESLCYVDGKPKGMFSTVGKEIDGRQDHVLLKSKALSGEKIDIAIECYAWHYETGLSCYENIGKDTASEDDFKKIFRNVTICTANEDIRELVLNLKILLDLEANKINEVLASKAMDMLEKVFSELILFPDACSSEEIAESVNKVNALIQPFFSENKAGEVNGFAGIIGHSHMDTAWLWPMEETVRKCARTYSNALSLMEQYPEYKFIQSSVLHTFWMEKFYPSIFENIKDQVKNGRYEPNGAAWVECDCNITGGEYMIRQFLKGQNYLGQKFGYHADSFWLPDTFGYSMAIPQIMQGCGIKYFYTTKLSWNEHNVFPFETFRWKGLDGSEVITHFNITHCEPGVNQLFDYVGAVQNKQADDSRLIAFGYGDGGGGPTDFMIREAAKVKKINGLPQTEYTTISEFGKRLESKKEKLPVYNGELYLELHRGTLTQMHNIKRNNRKAEIAIHNMELINVLTNADYDKEKYDEYVKILLENQFHDILPGTSLKRVHDKSVKVVNELIKNVECETNRCIEKVLDKDDKCITLVNTLSFERAETLHINSADGFIKNAKNQWVENIEGERVLAVTGINIKGFEVKTLDYAEIEEQDKSPFMYDGTTLETPFAKIVFNDDGYISSLIDKQSERELRRDGGEPLGSFFMGEDIAVFWDNWDIEYDQKFKMKVQKGFVTRKLISDGAVEMRLRSEFNIGKSSTLIQDMIVYSDSARIDFETIVDWKDKHQLLKVGFDLDILASTARHEIQFGFIDRPTTENNKIEAARFEVCNHKWTDVAETRFGVAVLNDCKYGISVRESDVRLSLHRGGCRPDYSGDFGVHKMTYSILPHNEAFNVNSVIKPAYELNVPVISFGGRAKTDFVPIKISADNIICETVKPAEIAENAYVLRLYEAEKNKTKTKLVLPPNVKKAQLCNMLEEAEKDLEIENSEIELTFRPFEIKTVMIRF